MGAAGTVVILAAGQGKRMRSAGPKVLQPLCGRPMLSWVLDQALALDPARVLVVVGVGAEEVRAEVESTIRDERIQFVRQERQLGTGHAVGCCLSWLAGEEGPPAETGPVLILYGDMPLLTSASLRQLLASREGTPDGMALVTARVERPRGFGRILRSSGAPGVSEGSVVGIVEERDASPEQLELREVNVGVYAFPGPALVEYLPRLSSDNAQGEFYLTDLVATFVDEGRAVHSVVLEDEREAIGVNTLAHLAEAREALQERILEDHLAAGVFIEDPSSTWIDWGVEIGPGTHILPATVIRSGVKVGANCEVGPFSHLRVGTVLEDSAEVGNFTETKKAVVGEGSKAKHLSYLGDVTIGARTNIGAGTIVANYDGVKKHPTVIGDRAFVGSGTVIVAPGRVGDGALTGAGAVLRRETEIPPGEAWVGVPARRLKRMDEGGGDSATDEARDAEGEG